MPEVFTCRFGATPITGIITASLFWQLDNSPREYQERVTFFAFVTIADYYICSDRLAIILQERNIMLRETTYNVYRLYSYWLSVSDALTWLSSLLLLSITYSVTTFWAPGLEGGFTGFSIYFGVILASFWAGNSYILFLSGLLPDTSRAYMIIVKTLGSLVLFCGVYVTRNEIPLYWIRIHYLSLKKYTYHALMHNEFDDPTRCIVTGIEVFDGTPFVGTEPVGLKEQLLRGISHVLGKNITSWTCTTTGPDLLKQRGMADIGQWECFWITNAWGIFFRILYFLCCLFMPHSSGKGDLIFDPEVEKTAHRLRKETRIRMREQSSTASLGLNLAVNLLNSSNDSEQEEIIMANNNWTLGELAASDLIQ
ncbi:ABC transporter G family member 6-like [Coffea eugenioides]|uniref:ABC transporter G family member 6-like n=1 Tax=Coffea eugenioides TaxID=49369 RepID=UPI000F613FA2|nr:ABC transporter G family member 6-like [Coffea eugenioides]